MIISRHHPITPNRANLWFSKNSLINLETTKNLPQLDLEHQTYTSLSRKGRGHEEHEDDYKSGPAGGGARFVPTYRQEYRVSTFRRALRTVRTVFDRFDRAPIVPLSYNVSHVIHRQKPTNSSVKIRAATGSTVSRDKEGEHGLLEEAGNSVVKSVTKSRGPIRAEARVLSLLLFVPLVFLDIPLAFYPAT